MSGAGFKRISLYRKTSERSSAPRACNLFAKQPGDISNAVAPQAAIGMRDVRIAHSSTRDAGFHADSISMYRPFLTGLNRWAPDSKTLRGNPMWTLWGAMMISGPANPISGGGKAGPQSVKTARSSRTVARRLVARTRLQCARSQRPTRSQDTVNWTPSCSARAPPSALRMSA